MRKKAGLSSVFLALLVGCSQPSKGPLELTTESNISCVCDTHGCCIDSSSVRDTMLRINSKEYRCRVVGIRNCESKKVFIPVSKFNTLLYSYSELAGKDKSKVINLSDFYSPQYREIGPLNEAEVMIVLDSTYDWKLLNVDFWRDTLNGTSFSVPLSFYYDI